MKPGLGSIKKGTALLLASLVVGCSSNGSTTVGGYYEYRYGYYDPWYRHDVIVRPPARPPVRPEHPIERPPSRPRPPVRPTPLPARPMPRPAPRRMR